MKIRYFLRSWILKTSTLIIFSTLVTMLIMFLIIGSSLYRHLSTYILEQSTKYTDSIAEQVQQRLNSTLSEIDSNIQQLCNDIQIQNILYRSQNNNVLSSEDQMTLRQKVMETLNYTDAVQQIEIYTAASPHQIYPFAQKSIFDFLTKTELDLIDEQNGKIVWLSNTKQENSYIRAGKRLLLSDYQFVHGGYLVMLLRPDFLEFFQEDFQQFSNSAVFLKDTTGNLIYFSSNNPEISIRYCHFKVVSICDFDISLFQLGTYYMHPAGSFKSGSAMAEPNPTGNLWNGRNIIFVLLSADRTNDFRPYQRYEKSNVYFQ